MLETTITLREREIKLKPDHKAIFQIEAETNLAIYDLIIKPALKTSEMACIIYNCAQSAKEDITKDELSELLIGEVSAEVILKCNELLNSVFGSKKSSGDSKKK